MLENSGLSRALGAFQYAQNDDIVFMTLFIFSGIFYNFYIRDQPDPYHHVWFEKPQQIDGNYIDPGTRDIGVKLEQSVGTEFSKTTQEGLIFVPEERSRGILGLPIRYCRKTCESLGPRLS
jgi:hypothetical protein